MKQARTLLFFLFAPVLIYAQSGKISGKIIDNADETAIEFGTITLFASQDSTVVSGTVSSEDGSFLLDKLPFGNFYLRANFIGYDAFIVSDIKLDASNAVTDLGAIKLSLSNELGTVDVTAQKSAFETRIDKKIFHADQSLVAKGGTGPDLLRQVPSITVDQNDNILLRGDGNVTILIDGRPTAMSPGELMKQIPASAIDQVELITNPSAKYDPEGMSGIINIVLKKNKLSGFNGSLNTSVGYSRFPKANGSLALNYRNDKINLSGNYSYNYRQTWFGGDLSRDVLIDTVWDRLRSDDYGERINQSHTARVGMDYFINEKNTFYLSGSYNAGFNDGSRDVNYRNLTADDLIRDYSLRTGNIDAPSENKTFNTGWQKTFKKPDHTLDLDLNYTVATLTTDERLSQAFYNSEDINYFNTFQNTAENNKGTNLLSKLDYVLPISDSLTLEAGFHFTSRTADNAFYSESGLENNALLPDTNLNNSFNYLQQVYASYVTLGKQFKKIGIKAGLRAENTFTTSELINTSEVFNNDYFELFPSVHLSYKTTRNSEFQVSYSKRINRPRTDQLNPFTNYSDPITLQVGNPFLRPEIIHVNEVSYLKYWQKFNINATLYYRLITDLIRRNLTYDGILSVVSHTNLGQSSLSGGDLNLTFLPLKGMRIMSSTSFWNTSTVDADLTGGERYNYFGLQTSLQGFYQMKKGWSTQIWGSYAMPMNVVQGVVAANYGCGFAVQKRIVLS